MGLQPGTRLGPYQILSPLGAGGMGEVYRARDTRLSRDVAIKVLPQHLSSNAEVRTRFEREAKTVSSLNHPHICTLFDVGREGDTDYLVMELIEGETLAARLSRGALPVADTLRIGSQIADALDRAHRAGVVHRDLKPGNIMLTKSGAKLMDFGLARVTGMAGGTGSGVSMASLTQSPTVAAPLTAEGTIVGTFQYMAPEQLEGKESDARSDLWALGCVLYEMATGRRAFEGKSQASLIGAIMNADPAPISQVAPLAPPELDRLVRACLMKDPADRLQSAHDVKLQLAWLQDGSAAAHSTTTASPTAPARIRRPWPLIVVAALAGAAIAVIATMLVTRESVTDEPLRTPQRYVLGSLSLTPESAPAIAPDGSFVIFSVRGAAERRLVRRDIGGLDLTPVPGTDGGAAPCVSPDGEWIAFCTPDTIKKIPISGGVAQVIAPVPRATSLQWAPDGTIYYTQARGGEESVALARVSSAGGQPGVVATFDTTAAGDASWLPVVLPDGWTVLISVQGERWHVDAVKADGSRVMLLDRAFLARYSDGYLIYVDVATSAAFCRAFDPASLTFRGSAVALTEPLDLFYCYDLSSDGIMVYVPVPGAGSGFQVMWRKRDGTSTPAFETRGEWTQPRLSPDGTRILIRKVATNCELWMYDIERHSLAKVVQNTDNHDPVWSPDGRRIAYLRNDTGGNMVVQTVAGARDVSAIDTGGKTGHPESWSAGGNVLVFTVNEGVTRSDVWTCTMDGTPTPKAFLATSFDEKEPSISRDGRYIAYVTDETGSDEVFVRHFPDTGESWQVSVGDGQSPLWSRDGSELFYTVGTSMMSVPIDTRNGFHVREPVVLFTGGFNTDRPHNFDVAPDGRFLVLQAPGGASGEQEVRVLVNWPEKARQLMGTTAP